MQYYSLNYLCIILHNMNISSFFQKLGLEEKTVKVLLATLQLGYQPASVIAKHAGLDRTSTYRLLKELLQKKLVAESKKRGISVFYVEKLSVIEDYLNDQKKKTDALKLEFEALMPELANLRGTVQELPKIQIYEGYERLKVFYRDIVNRAEEQKLLLIRILGSNTFAQKLEQKNLGELIEDFKKMLQEKKIEVDIVIAEGTLTREWVSELHSLSAMANLPAAGGATNVILVGESVFIISFRDFPVGLRIDHPDIAQTMHFLFDRCGNLIPRRTQILPSSSNPDAGSDTPGMSVRLLPKSSSVQG